MTISSRRNPVLSYLYNMRFSVHSFILINMEFFLLIIFPLSSHFQKPARKSFILFSFFLSFVEELYYRHDVIPYAVKVLKEAGYQLVTVAECLGQDPYLSVDAPSARDVCLVFFSWPIFFFDLCVLFLQDTWKC